MEKEDSIFSAALYAQALCDAELNTNNSKLIVSVLEDYKMPESFIKEVIEELFKIELEKARLDLEQQKMQLIETLEGENRNAC